MCVVCNNIQHSNCLQQQTFLSIDRCVNEGTECVSTDRCTDGKSVNSTSDDDDDDDDDRQFPLSWYVV